MDINIVWSEDRQEYDLFYDGEWYAQGDYEYIKSVADNIRLAEIDEAEEFED